MDFYSDPVEVEAATYEPEEEMKQGEKKDAAALVVDDPALELGNTEIALISLWAVFTAAIFALLYKITREADEEHQRTIKTVTLKELQEKMFS